MLHKVKNGHGRIIRGLPELRGLLPPTQRNKMALLDTARRGDPRPSQKTRIGRALSQYTSPSSDSYDGEFHKKIRGIRPDWVLSQTAVAAQKKKQLLDMAKRGDPRPSFEKTRIGQALSNYTRKSSEAYDPEFDREIRALRPDWFR